MNNLLRCGLVAGLLLSFSGCGVSGPKTQYYSLFPGVEANQETRLEGDDLSFGVGPIILPEYLQQTSIVSRNAGQQLTVSGVNAWGGDLNATLSRVLATNLSTLWQQDDVWAFPWDTRARPNYQIRIVFEDFSGVRGGKVTLKARWLLLGNKGKQQLAVGLQELSESTSSNSAEAYVSVLDNLLKRFSVNLSKQIKKELVAYEENEGR
ncbi:PqiC family protein [Teredinibacter turnerae]|uniref:PqiC family protein n=1 Tax=Teredinibacter turnerae TaxID=2426 RepID=UPI0003699B82|nr:PqiC family protein [Teredinibacter turnerae]